MSALNDSFFGSYHNLTDEQFAAIGRVAAQWSLLEFMLEAILVTLAMTPGLPGLALTNDLSIDNRLKAFRNLIRMHRLRYGEKLCSKEALDALEPLPREIAHLKDRRNRIIHYVWFRHTDEKLIGFRFAGKHPIERPKTKKQRAVKAEMDDWNEDSDTSLATTVIRMRRFADQIDETTNRLYEASLLLPTIDEDQLPKWLQPALRRPRSDTRSAHPNRPPPSPE